MGAWKQFAPKQHDLYVYYWVHAGQVLLRCRGRHVWFCCVVDCWSAGLHCSNRVYVQIWLLCVKCKCVQHVSGDVWRFVQWLYCRQWLYVQRWVLRPEWCCMRHVPVELWRFVYRMHDTECMCMQRWILRPEWSTVHRVSCEFNFINRRYDKSFL
jgi:hypothetical protein